MTESKLLLPVPGGEVLGSVLLGLIHSFKEAQIGLNGNSGYLAKHIHANEWYPMSYFFMMLDELKRHKSDLAPLLFQAGIKFVDNFYYLNGGKDITPCAMDFLHLQSKNGGYSLVHRGDPSQVGWQDLVELNEPEGRATVVCFNPYPTEFERGIMHRGISIGGDVDCVNVESVEEPYNRYLRKKTHVITFKQKKAA